MQLTMNTKTFLPAAIIAGSILVTSCSHDDMFKDESDLPSYSYPDSSTENRGDISNNDVFTSLSTVGDVINDPAFGNFGRLLFPVDRHISSSLTLAQVSSSSIYMWYPYIRAEKTVEIINYLHSQATAGNQIFFRIYSDAEIAADPSKTGTGLFLFKGNTGKPFSVTNAGGGFAYVGAMHDSFPHSLELSKAGYNAFALIYRPDDPYRDLAKAITFIYDNAEKLGVSKENYSLWGGSAGARMAATLGNKTNLQLLTGRTDIPQAAAIIMQYTGYTAVSEFDPPTYNCVGSNDGIAQWRTMQNRLQYLSQMGIATEFHVYEGLGHGFGIGTGTIAEGWVKDAIDFWEKNMAKDYNTGIPPIYAD